MSAAAEAARRKQRNARIRERRRLQRLHRFEDAARSQGFTLVGGIDEVGRGPLAGPVVAACVVTNGPLMIVGLDDSKKVRPEIRSELADTIKGACTAWSVGVASVAEIERLNIYWASILAMERALAALAVPPEYLITDAVRIRSPRDPKSPSSRATPSARPSPPPRSSRKCTATGCSSNSTPYRPIRFRRT